MLVYQISLQLPLHLGCTLHILDYLQMYWEECITSQLALYHLPTCPVSPPNLPCITSQTRPVSPPNTPCITFQHALYYLPTHPVSPPNSPCITSQLALYHLPTRPVYHLPTRPVSPPNSPCITNRDCILLDENFQMFEDQADCLSVFGTC